MTRKPIRVQQRRTAGWRKPEGAIAVGRGTRWGNPFVVGRGRDQVRTNLEAVEKYRAYVLSEPGMLTEVRRWLVGADLMCWCRIGEPCHADVLLALANNTPYGPVVPA